MALLQIEGRDAELREAAYRCGGEALLELPAPRPTYLWLFGSTMVEAVAEPDGGAMVRAYLVLQPETAALATELETWSEKAPLGRIVADEDGDVVLLHRIPPDCPIDADLQLLCSVSDGLDDEMCEALGGVRAVDRFQADVLDTLLSVRPSEMGPPPDASRGALPDEPQPQS